MGLCQFDQPPPRLRLDVRRVDDGEATRIESLRSNEVQHLERSVGRLLVVLVVGDEPAAEVGRDHLGLEEVARRERGLAGARDTDENDQAKVGDLDRLVRVHRVNTAICVGAPTSSSCSPTGEICNS